MPTRGETFSAGGSPWYRWRRSDAGVNQAAANRLAGQRVDDVAERAAGVQRAVEGHGEAVVLFLQAVFVLEAEAVVQGELRADAPVVLRVDAVVVA